jgi:hypothetical protein
MLRPCFTCSPSAKSRWAWLLLGLLLTAARGETLHLVNPSQYSGMCDASGAVPVTSNLFLIANDEDNILRLYRSDQPGPPVQTYDFNAFLEVEGKSLEADLEGAARIGDRAFWIGSHGRNKNGKERLNRCRLFATDIRVTNGTVVLTPVGRPCKTLLDDLLGDPRLDSFRLAEAARKTPKDPDALNIEGLAATPEGHLLIGFRNPIPDGKALLIPLKNPNDVIQGKPAQFGSPIQLDLGGLGIRDIACWNGAYVIIAGPFDGGKRFRLYRWGGPGAVPEAIKTPGLNEYHPEALILYQQTGTREFQILSDDGTQLIGDCPCKDLPDPRQRVFRSVWASP